MTEHGHVCATLVNVPYKVSRTDPEVFRLDVADLHFGDGAGLGEDGVPVADDVQLVGAHRAR